MQFSRTLSIYVGRQFLVSFLMLFVLFVGLILLFDTVELLRRAASKPNVTVGLILEMSLLKLPRMAGQLFPFATLFGGMMTFWRLTRTNELVVTRAAGVSAWQFLAPALVIAAGIGIFQVSVFNPVSSVFLLRFDQLEARYLKGQTNLMAISPTGLWLRQANLDGQSVVHANTVLQKGVDVELRDVTIFAFRGADNFVERIQAGSGRLEDGFWHLRDVAIFKPEAPVDKRDQHLFETDLTIGKIQDSFASPETMSFWDLPGFIKTLENSGFSATRHRLYWHSLLASPLLLCAMVLIAATFTLRHARRGGMLFVISGGVLTGFLLFFFSDLVYALGLSDSIPVVLAAWSPSGISTLLGLAMLLHLEDG